MMTSQTATMTMTCEQLVFPTELGWFGFALQDETIVAVVIGENSARSVQSKLSWKLRDAQLPAAAQDKISRTAKRLRDDLQRAASGESVSFEGYKVSTDHLTPFQQLVVETVSKIPHGHTMSYAEVAEQAGSPGAARAVGNVMAGNRTPIVVPCHRVLASGGRLGGFSAPGGVDFKRRLLALEGVHSHNNKSLD